MSAQEKSKAPPALPPQSFNAYAKTSEEGAGVTQIMDLTVEELDGELQDAEIDEKDAQKTTRH